MRAPTLEEYYLFVGKIVTNWSMLEARLASAIWRIGEIHDAIGASITSQIFTLDGKVKALQAILREKGFQKEAANLGAVIDGIKGLSETRNRIVHDPVHFMNGEVHRLEIKANRHLSFGYQKVDLNKMMRIVDHINDADTRIQEALKPALDAIPRISSRDKSGVASP